jgi:hypothetical protein
VAQQDTRGIYSVESTAAGLPVTTALEFPEWQIQRYLGLCFGLVVRSMGP